MAAIFGLRSFRYNDVPASVPPVPTAEAKSRQCPKGLILNFRTGAVVMSQPVGDDLELVCPEPAMLLRQALGHAVVIARIPVRFFRHGDDLCAERAQQADFLRRLRFRNDNDGTITPGMTDDGEADAGVAGGALDNGVAGLEHTPVFGVGDDAERGAILYRAARIHEFSLAQNFAAGQFGEAAQPDQWRVSDVALDSVIRWRTHAFP